MKEQAIRLRSCERRSDSSYALWSIGIMMNRLKSERHYRHDSDRLRGFDYGHQTEGWTFAILESL